MKNSMNIKTVLVLVLSVCSFSLVSFTQAQTVHYKTETRMKMHMLGAMSNMMGNKPQVSDVYVSDQYMLSVDGKRSSSLMSAANGTIATLDHKKKTYYEMSFDEMASMFTAMQEDGRQQIDDAGYDPADMQFSVQVEALGSGGEVAGHNTEKKRMIMELAYTAETSDDAQNAEQVSGKFYTVTEMWISKNVPGSDIVDAFSNNYASAIGQSFEHHATNRMAGMQQMFMSDGRMGPAMEQLAEEMKKLEGTPLKTVTYVVLGPDGQELDLDAVLNQKEEKKKKRRGGLGRLAKNALKNQGLNLGGNDEQAAPAEGVTEQTILTETETLYLLMEIVEDDPNRFTIPSNYKKVDTPSYFDGGN